MSFTKVILRKTRGTKERVIISHTIPHQTFERNNGTVIMDIPATSSRTFQFIEISQVGVLFFHHDHHSISWKNSVAASLSFWSCFLFEEEQGVEPRARPCNWKSLRTGPRDGDSCLEMRCIRKTSILIRNKALSFGIPCICDILWSGCQFGIIGFHRVSCCRYVYGDSSQIQDAANQDILCFFKSVCHFAVLGQNPGGAVKCQRQRFGCWGVD